MRRIKMAKENNHLIINVLAGIVGFTIGAVLFYKIYINYHHTMELGIVSGSAFFGAITCGLSLGLVVKDLKRAIKLAVFGGIGFFFAGVEIVSYPLFLFLDIFSFLIIGAIGGAFYGVALWDIKKLVKMAIAGSLGLFTGVVVGIISIILIKYTFIAFIISGIIVGAFLGAGMYFAEKDDIK